MAGKVFISYRQGSDVSFARRLLASLRGAFQPGEIVLGDGAEGVNWLRERVRECDIFLAMIDADWLEQTRQMDDPLDHVRVAIEEALRQHRRIIPVLLGEAAMPHAGTLPATIRPLVTLHVVRVRQSGFNASVTALVNILKKALEDTEPPKDHAATDNDPAKILSPEIPEQGYGPHFEIGDDGVVTLAPPAALDRQGNNIDRLKRMHPELRDLSRELAEALGKGNIPHVYLLDRAKAYQRQIDQDLEHIDFALLYMAGVRLANAEKAAAGDRELPTLPVSVRETIDSLLQFHGTFMLATREGLESIEAEQRYRRTQQEEVEYRKAAIDFARSLQNQPTVVDSRAAAVVMTAAEDIGKGANPERSGTVATGAMKNITVTIAAGAAIGAIPVAAVAMGSTLLAVLASPACLIATEGLKKSKSFSALAVLVTMGLDTVAETELSNALAKVRALFAPQVRFLLSAKEQLGRLAGRSDEFKWLTRTVRWVEQEVETKQPVALPPADPPRRPQPEPQLSPPPPEPGLLGNIYLGRISVVEPVLQAAFVDYGAERNGFLSFHDIHPDYYQIPVAERQRLIIERPVLIGGRYNAAEVNLVASEGQNKIQDIVKRGQVVLVQIVKEEVRDKKGVVFSTHLSLAGRFLVLMPNNAGVAAVSSAIVSPPDRERLKTVIQMLPVPDGMSIILREAGASRRQAEIEDDLKELIARWDALRDLASKSSPPSLIYNASANEPPRGSDGPQG